MRSIPDTRAEIAAALETMDGVSAYLGPPAVITPGMAWPRWVSSAPVNDWSRERVWEIFVTVAGSGDQATVAVADEIESALDAALATIDNAMWSIGEPVLLNTGTPGDTVPALRFRVVTST